MRINGRMRHALLFLCLAVTFSLTAQEIPVNEPVLVGGAEYVTDVAIASNGTRFLAAWTKPVYHGHFSYELYTQTLNQAADPPATLRNVAGEIQHPVPAVASDGQDYLVVSGGVGGTEALRVDADGRRIDVKAILVHPATRTPLMANDQGYSRRSVAWDGARYVITSAVESFSTPRLIASTVDATGRVLTSEIAVQDGTYYAPVAARNGVAVIAVTVGGLVKVRTLTGGDVLSPSVTIGNAFFAPTTTAAAAGDDGFLIVWNDAGNMRARHLSPSGEPDSGLLNLGLASSGAVLPTATWHRGEYLVAWYGATVAVTASGNLRQLAAAIPSTSMTPTLASNGVVAILTYRSDQPPFTAVARVVDDVVARREFPLEWAPPAQTSPVGAASGSLLGVAWTEAQDVYFQRITTRGLRLDRQGTVIGPGIAQAIAANDSGFLILWTKYNGGTYLTRVARDGTVGDTAPSPLAATGKSEVLPAGDEFVVLSITNDGLAITRLSQPATTLVSESRLDFAAATNGHELLIVYRATLGQPRGIFVDPSTLQVTPISTPLSDATFNSLPLSVASDGTDFLFAWTESNEVRARIVRRNGDWGPVTTIASNLLYPGAPQIVTTAGGYMIVWADYETAVGTVKTIHEAFVNRDGVAGAPHNIMTAEFATPIHSIASPPYLLYSREALTTFRAFVLPLDIRRRAVTH